MRPALRAGEPASGSGVPRTGGGWPADAGGYRPRWATFARAEQEDYNESGAAPYTLRSPGQLARFFDGLDLAEPGLVSVTPWRPEASSAGLPAEPDAFGAVGRKP